MTATVTLIRAEPSAGRSTELTLAHTHLRLGALALARVELETMYTLGMLDTIGLVDLAEARWRSGDLTGAGEAARAAMRVDTQDAVALVIAGEAASANGRPGEARGLAQRAMAMATGSIDAIFAGMPRSAVWPADADEPPPTAPTLFDRGPEAPAPADPGAKGADAAAAAADGASTPARPSGPVARGFWDEETTDTEPPGLPDPPAELEAGRAAIVAGALDEAALHLGLALRLAPALAPAILEATSGARGAALSIVRGDAYRLAGHEAEARNAYAVAAQGGPPERRKRSRTVAPAPAAPAAAGSTAGPDAKGAAGGNGATGPGGKGQTNGVAAAAGAAGRPAGPTPGAVAETPAKGDASKPPQPPEPRVDDPDAGPSEPQDGPIT